MKLCAVSNYNGKGYINEPLILKELYNTLGIDIHDTYTFRDFNAPYIINKKYTHLIINYDYKASSIQMYLEFLKEIKIPKIFIIDTIPEEHRRLNREFLLKYYPQVSEGFTALSQKFQNILYEEYADALVFFNQRDKNLFSKYYTVSPNKPIAVIPPSIGKEKDIKVNIGNLKQNKNIVYNGIPSYSNGLHITGQALYNLQDFNLDVYGTHGRTDLNNQLLMNDLLRNLPNVKFKARVRRLQDLYENYHMYIHLPIYDSFDYCTFKSILNGVIPIIGKNSSSLEFLKDYPFTTSDRIENIEYTINILSRSNKTTLEQVLINQEANLKELNNEASVEKYKNLIKSI